MLRGLLLEPYSGEEPEIDMNKIFTVALIAGGLLLLDAPEAAAHKEVRSVYQPPAFYRFELRRTKHMPHWLKRNQSFRKWYKHTHLRRNRHLAWHELFDIYRWERADARKHRRGSRHYRYYDDFRYGYRNHYRDHNRYDKRGHRH